MAVCASAKLDCLLNDCCAGFCMYYEGSTPVLFPSAILEMIVWSIFVVLLLLIERKQFASGILWPISMIWFGAARFLFDYFRGSIWERKPFFLTMSAGQFWSLVALLIGAVFLFFTLRNKLERKPRLAELLKSIFGMRIIQDFKDAET
jgi:prolipoprotein diacylglyceryltransferase